MKKLFVTGFLILLIIFSISLNVTAFSNDNNKMVALIETDTTPKNSKEKLYQDVFITVLLSSLQNTVDNYYKEYLSVSPTVAPYDVTILKLDRLGENRTFDFLLKLEIHPYVGPHLDVGIDYITIRINPMDKVKVEKFEHIKSYELPLYYQDIVKKKLP